MKGPSNNSRQDKEISTLLMGERLTVHQSCDKTLFAHNNLRRDFLVIIVALFPTERMPASERHNARQVDREASPIIIIENLHRHIQ